MRLGLFLAMCCPECGNPTTADSSDIATDAKLQQAEYGSLLSKDPSSQSFYRCSACGQLCVKDKERDSVDS